MKTNGIVLLTFIFLTSTLFGCGKQDASVGLESIDVPEIEKIEHTGTTCLLYTSPSPRDRG